MGVDRDARVPTSEVWKRRSREKRLEGAASKVGGKLGRCDVLSENVVDTGKHCWKMK